MSGTDSSPSIKMSEVGEWLGSQDLLSKEAFSSFASKLVRRAIASQFVPDDHPVLVDEDRLIAESVHEMREYLGATTAAWGPNMGLAKLAVMGRIRSLALERLGMHDLDDASAEEASRRILATDLSPVFPESWSDC